MLVITHKDKAIEYFDKKFHCSQAVLAAFADECGLTETQALKLGACLGTGMRKGEVCGACTGALLVLGSLYGQCNQDDIKSRLLANEVNDKMMDQFAQFWYCFHILSVRQHFLKALESHPDIYFH